MTEMNITVEKLDACEAENIVESRPDLCFDARRVTFDDRDDLIVIVYAAGPTRHMQIVCEAIEKLSREDSSHD